MNRPSPAAGTGLGLILGTVALIVLVTAPPTIAGAPTSEVAAALVFAGAAFFVTGRAAAGATGSPGATLNALALWAVGLGLLGLLYSHRAGLSDAAGTALDGSGLVPIETSVSAGGEITIVRRGDGFLVPARINDRDARFVFDTGASTVVLTHETAALLGLKPDTLRYRVPVGTANGSGLAAPVTIARISVGPITMERVVALVARPGLLGENLLGMSFLERLASYEVRGNRLVLRAVRS